MSDTPDPTINTYHVWGQGADPDDNPPVQAPTFDPAAPVEGEGEEAEAEA